MSRPPLRLGFAPSATQSEVLVTVDIGAHRLGTIFFRSPTGDRLTATPDALCCLGLYPASECGVDLMIDGAVDARLLAQSAQITATYADWWPGCRPVTVTAQSALPPPRPPRGAAAFFSGGIDSSFTLAEARPRLAALITLIGADVPLSQPEEGRKLAASAAEVARGMGLSAIVIETNTREVLGRLVGWMEYHGAVLAAIGHLLSDRIGHVLIASSGDAAAWHTPWGSHPGLDPLYGTPDMTVEHHGLIKRLDKLAAIVGSEVLMAHLRVCNHGRTNCGQCNKCSFAMLGIDLLGAADAAPTFPPYRPGAGHIHARDPAFFGELLYLRQAVLSAGRGDLLPDLDRGIAEYRRRARRHRLVHLATPRLPLFRVLKHRYRYARFARLGRLA
ncbi:MAG: hypothetical protein RIT14_350 [Pseudomonadota bacterium]